MCTWFVSWPVALPERHGIHSLADIYRLQSTASPSGFCSGRASVPDHEIAAVPAVLGGAAAIGLVGSSIPGADR
jgi:hypothetical protein